MLKLNVSHIFFLFNISQFTSIELKFRSMKAYASNIKVLARETFNIEYVTQKKLLHC